jgi:hypothetical protein
LIASLRCRALDAPGAPAGAGSGRALTPRADFTSAKRGSKFAKTSQAVDSLAAFQATQETAKAA